MIPPQPVPTELNVGQAQGPNGVMVVLTISDPTGSGTWFLPPNCAKAVGEQLTKAGEAGDILIAQPAPAGVDLAALKAATSGPPGPNRAERRQMEREIERVRSRAS